MDIAIAWGAEGFVKPFAATVGCLVALDTAKASVASEFEAVGARIITIVKEGASVIEGKDSATGAMMAFIDKDSAEASKLDADTIMADSSKATTTTTSRANNFIVVAHYLTAIPFFHPFSNQDHQINCLRLPTSR